MINYKKILSLILPILLFGSIFISCNDDVTLNNKVDEGEYVDVTKQALALRSYTSSSEMQNAELRDKPQNLAVYLRQAQSASTDLTGTIAVNEAALTAYNTKNGTAFKMFPANLTTIPNASVTISAGKTQSDSIGIVIKEDASLVAGTSYILPITFTRTSGSDIANSKDDYLFIVKYMGAIPSTAKESGIFTIMYFEVNDTNILNAGEYTLKDSGKPFADAVVIFAANINFDKETGKVYVNMNENVQAILDNRDKYIKPLQDKGIKVLLSILGNHDGSGIANLSNSTAKDYAQQLKRVVDVYGLDGIEFDDEWSDYGDYNLQDKYPGFVYPSSNAFARLCYETKNAMRDKLVTVYHYGKVGFSSAVEGELPGSFVDYVVEASYGYYNSGIQNSYKGMSKKQVAPYSRNIHDGMESVSGYWNFGGYGQYNIDYFKQLVTDGFGANMLYSYNTAYVDQYEIAFNEIAKVLYNEEITWSGKVHPKDWAK